MDPISATCRTNYKASRTSGTRKISAIKLLVLHSTEGGTAEGVARMFSSPTAKGSSHLVVDDSACYRCLPNTAIPWAAPNANTQGFHIEQCGYAAWTGEEWDRHLPMLHRAAYKLALHSLAFKVPLFFLNAEALKAGHKGVTTHGEVSKAWPNNAGNHHDPGQNYPLDLVLTLASYYQQGMNV